MADEASIACQILDITKTLSERNVNFSLKLNFTMNNKVFDFSASSSKKDEESPTLQEKRKQKSPSQKARNLKRWLDHKEKMKKKLEPTNASIKPNLDSTDTQKTELSENVEKPLVSCDMCGHTTKTKNGMKLHMQRKHDIDQIDGNTSIEESEELSEPDNCECIEAETGYSQLTGKFAWHRKKQICTQCANRSS